MVHLVRTKKLRSGKRVVRSLRTIHNPPTTLTEKDGKRLIAVDIDHKWAVARLDGMIDPASGNASLNTTSCEVRGYLKGRNFEVVGYNFEARITNENLRRKPVKLG